jgi:threonine/homoserine/homoserine lactone efflux protein
VGPELAAFVLASIVLIVVPGVDFALVTRQVVTYGRRAALTTAGGLLVAGLTHATLAAVGLSALLLASAKAYAVVKLAGAVYLIWLGIQFLRSAGREHRHALDNGAPRAREISARRSFALGLASNLLNVKMAVFFVTFLPQFVPTGGNVGLHTLLLGLLFNVLASSWWMMYILLVSRIRPWLARERIRKLVDRVTGGVLVAVGGSLAAADRPTRA